MIVMDKARKIFDRNSGFRKSCESLKQIHARFQETPVMALTTTIHSASLDKLCMEYPREVILIKGNVDRPNIKLSLGKCKLATGKKASESDNSQSTQPWKNIV